MSVVAIVTGSDSGIGRATAAALAAGGFDVGITYEADRDGAETTAAEVRRHGRRPAIAPLDLVRTADIPDTLGRLADDLGGLDVMVNNAGTGHTTPFLDLDLETWRHVLEVDLTGTFVAGQAAARRMVDAGTRGRVINVTSVHEHVPLRGSSAYCAAKGGLGLLTKVMAVELAEHGITVNAIAPGEIATPMTGAENVDPHTVPRPGIPLGRPGDAREVAAAIAFLAGPGSSYVTGHSFVVDGGMLLMAAVANQQLLG
ncbi:MAG TPA: SDR family oxidoreductase [Solirubrobacteraceae bacterium]|nr:SDR family oxidoreductase [Solirubrobacteraceae bacterium]